MLLAVIGTVQIAATHTVRRCCSGTAARDKLRLRILAVVGRFWTKKLDSHISEIGTSLPFVTAHLTTAFKP
jgi:hypothetical protein